MATKSECYADTSALIALLGRSDSYHPVFAILFAEPPPLVTSALVIAEGRGWFLRRYDQRRASQFLRFIETLPDLTIMSFDASALGKAGAVAAGYRRLALGGATLVI